MPTSAEPSGWTKGAVWVLGLVVPLAISGLGVLAHVDRDNSRRQLESIDGRLEASEGVVSGLTVSVARSLEHVEQHKKQSEYWIGRIEKNTEELNLLRTKSSARPDPFTGTQGRVLERRIDALERMEDRVQWLTEQIKEVKADLKEQQGYYRRQVLPLLEQSNSLQIQHLQRGEKP